MALSTPTRALQALGYSLVYIKNNTDTFPTNLTPDELLYVADLVTKIETIDTELLENTRDSMAVKVQDLGLDYSRYISQTLALQDRYKEKLSDTIGVKNFKGSSQNTSSLLVRSYY